ncbi:6-pyruvoyl-tetrahydropterin synthase related domain; membrane protein [uncultured archaeon]|nr:6-pyruvoyl-tetrahydropterin synthase related domain; membrane protein [uncultured archaeon]
MKISRLEWLVTAAVFLGIFWLILSFFRPAYLFSDRFPSGGDTPSHVHPYLYLKEYLIPHGELIGWDPGWYAGYPLFQYYFLVPYVVMLLFNLVFSAAVAFKLGEVLAVFALPVAVYLAFRAMKFSFPTPLIAAVFSLQFLFLETINGENYSMYGGNIKSLLAGEFAHAYGTFLGVLFFGFLYQGVKEKKHVIRNAIVLSLTVLSHIFLVIFAAISSSFFVFKRRKADFLGNVRILILVFGLGYLLVGFYTIPFNTKMGYTTSYDWLNYHKPGMLFPSELNPFYLLVIFGLYMALRSRDDRIYYMLYSIVVSAVIYLIIPNGNLWETRFLPPIYLMYLLIAAYGLGELVKNLEAKALVPLLAFLAITAMITASPSDAPDWVPAPIKSVYEWADQNTARDITGWIKWNFEGAETKANYQDLVGLMSYLKDLPYGRIFHEYSGSHDHMFGSSRTFESIPRYTGKPTMEGLFIDAAVFAPFEFILQPELSDKPSCPISYVPCQKFNLDRGIKHLQALNIDYFVATTSKVKNALSHDSNFNFMARFGDIEVYRINNSGHYVTVPAYQPVLFKTSDWRKDGIAWYQREDLLDVPLVYASKITQSDVQKYGAAISYDGNLDNLPKVPVEGASECVITENRENERLEFNTTCPGKPHIISISYFPNWKTLGASDPIMVSPAFMLITPTSNHVILYYGHTTGDYIGTIASILSITAIILLSYAPTRKKISPIFNNIEKSFYTEASKTSKKISSSSKTVENSAAYGGLEKTAASIYQLMLSFSAAFTELFSLMRLPRIRDRLGQRLMIYLVFFLLFISCASFVREGTNPGSRFMLVKALVKYHTLQVPEDEMKVYSGMDYSIRNGVIYSDKPPGLAYSLVPAYLIGNLLYYLNIPLPVSGYYNDPADGYAYTIIVLMIAAISAYGALRTYDSGILLNLSERASLAAAFILSAGTIYWVYAPTLFSHATTATCLVVAFYHMLVWRRDGGLRQLVYAGGWLGYAVTVDTTVLFVFPLYFAYVAVESLISSKDVRDYGGVRKDINHLLKAWGALAALVLLCGLLLAAYNTVAFGSPNQSAYQYAGMSSTQNFKNNPIEGYYILLVSTWRGLFFYSPILLLALPGAILLYRKRPSEALFLICVPVVHTTFISAYSYASGGLAFGPRHLVLFLPFLALLAAVLFDGAYLKRVQGHFGGISKWVLLAVSLLLLAVSVFHAFLGAYVTPIPYPEVNKNPIYEINLKLFYEGRKNGLLSNQHPWVFGLDAVVVVVFLAYLAFDIKSVSAQRHLSSVKKNPVFLSLFTAYLLLFGAFYFGYFREASTYGGGIFPTSFLSPSRSKMDYDSLRVSLNPVGAWYSSDYNDAKWSSTSLPAVYPVKGRESRFFRGEFTVDSVAKTKLNISADDCIKTLAINGQIVYVEEECGICTHCNGEVLDVTPYLTKGKNTIAIELVNAIGASSLSVQGLSGIIWRTSRTAAAGWTDPGYNDDGWDLTDLPFSEEVHVFRSMYVRARFTLPESFDLVQPKILADDCVANVYVNGQQAYSSTSCGPGSDKNGRVIDITKYVHSGGNLMAIQISDVGEDMSFDLK